MRFVFGVLVLALGCATTQPSGPAIFRLAEVTSAGSVLPYPETSLGDVDPNSSVLIQVQQDRLQPPAASLPAANPDRVEALRRLAELQRNVNMVMQLLVGVANFGGRELTAEQQRRFAEAYRRSSDILREVTVYAVASNTREDLSKSIGRDPGFTGALKYLASQHAVLQAQVAADLASVPMRRLELAAWLGSPPTQVHLPGYDDLAPGEPHLVDKTRFVFNERFNAEVAAARELAHEAQQANSIEDFAKDVVRKKIDTLQNSAQRASSLFDAIADQVSKLTPQSLAKLAKEGQTEFAQVVNEAKNAETKCRAVLSAVLPVIDAAAHPRSDADTTALLSNTVTALQRQRDAAQECVNAITQTAALLKRLEPAVGRATGEVKSALAVLINSTRDLHTNLAAIAAGAEGSVVAAAPRLSTIPVTVAEAKDTTLSLVNTPRTQGDLVTIRARVLEGAGDQQRVVPGGETLRYLRVSGWPVLAETGGAVLWVRPLKRDPGPFKPSAAAYAVMRLTGWRSPGQAGLGALSVLQPGLGAAVAVIPNDDGSTHLAWLGVAQAFGDILQVGIGVRLDANVTPVWAVGFGLHRIAGLGKFF